MTSESEAAGQNAELTPYEKIGGEKTVRLLVDRFYDIMDSDLGATRIRAMHAADPGPVRELLFEFLSGWLGGPPIYFKRAEHRCIMSAHRPYKIGEAERDEWMMCMRRAMEECALQSDMRARLDHAFLRMADLMRNS